MKLLLVGSYAAAAQYIEALLSQLTERGHQYVISLDSTAAEIMKRDHPEVEFIGADEEPGIIFHQVKPDHICCCTAGGRVENPWEKQVAQEAHKRGIIWTGHEDMELTSITPQNRGMWLKMEPAKIFVAEMTSLDGLKSLGVPAEKIIVAGNPTWDEQAKYDLVAARRAVHQKLNIEGNDRLIVFLAGKGFKLVQEEIDYLLSSLNPLTKDYRIFLVVYFHPGDQEWKDTWTKENPHGIFADNLARADEGIAVLAGKKLEAWFEQLAVLAAADLFITWGSTRSLTTAIWGIPTIRPFTPGNNQKAKEQGRPMPNQFATVATGCQLGLGELKEWSEALPQLLDPKSDLVKSMRKNCETYYPREGNIAEKIVQAIEELH